MTIYNGNRRVVQFLSSTASATSSAGVVDYARDFYGGDLRWISVRNLGQNNALLMTTVLKMLARVTATGPA